MDFATDSVIPMLESIGTIGYYAFAFILALGPLVAVHEWGHFWVARKLGVKVLRYSVGFGKPLWRRVGRDGVEYVVAAIPLGGYVKMLDEREGDVPADQVHQAFNRQGVWTRIAIVAAGPGVNLLFAVFAFWLMFMVGVGGYEPRVGAPDPDSAAERAGVRAGEVIAAVNGREVGSWNDAQMEIVKGVLDDGLARLTLRDDAGVIRERTLDLGAAAREREPEALLDGLGLSVYVPAYALTVTYLQEGAAAQRAGLELGDVIRTIDGREIATMGALIETVEANPDQNLRVRVERDGQPRMFTVRPKAVENAEGRIVGKIGLGSRPPAGLLDPYRVEVRFGPMEALGRAAEQTWDNTVFMVVMLGRLATGQISLKHISGPLRIAELAGLVAQQGLAKFLRLLALLSLTLGVMNLLPVPVLDGGHLLYYFIEVVRGAPLSEQAQLMGQRLGVAFLLGLMGLEFYNDLVGIFGV